MKNIKFNKKIITFILVLLYIMSMAVAAVIELPVFSISKPASIGVGINDKNKSSNHAALADSCPTRVEDSILVLVNKQNAISVQYRLTDLVRVNVKFNNNATEEEKMMRREAAQALEEMFAAAHNEGIELYGLNGFRSYKTQEALYNQACTENGKSYADNYVAKPGYSEHQTGLAMDVTNKFYSTSFETTKEGKWLAKNCYKYGFILRYPLDKQSITGYGYEPWHVRYVGKSAAEEIFAKGMVLEEYLKSS